MLSQEQLLRFIQTSGESSNIDAKGPIEWDGSVISASLAKDIVAFANSRDGGVIVIGKSEGDDGKFPFDGLSAEQASSFETTKIAAWVNARFQPPVNLVCHHQDYEERRFVILVINEFSDMPSLCVRGFQVPGKNDFILRERTLYVRNLNAESVPLGNVEELRELIGLATKKRGDEMLSFFNAMLKGRPLAPEPTSDDLFAKDQERVATDLELDNLSGYQEGSWRFTFHPGRYEPSRWADRHAMESSVRRYSVKFHEFPEFFTDPHPREWGIANGQSGFIWALTQSGLFIYARKFFENTQDYTDPLVGHGSTKSPTVQRGHWLEFVEASLTLFCFFDFMARFTSEFDADESVSFQITAGPLADRLLLNRNSPLIFGHYARAGKPCQASLFTLKKSLSVAVLRADWREECARCMKELVDLFPGYNIELSQLSKFIEGIAKTSA